MSDDGGFFWVMIGLFGILIVWLFSSGSGDRRTAQEEERKRTELEADEAAREKDQRKEQERRRNLLRAEVQPHINEARQGVRDNPHDADRRIRLGHLLIWIGEPRDAQEQYETALSVGISDRKAGGLVHLLYSYCLLRDGHLAELSLSFEAVSACQYEELRDVIWTVAIHSRFPSTEAPQGDLAAYHLDRAIRSFESTIRSNPTDIGVMRVLRGIYDGLGNRGKQKGRIESLIVEAETARKISRPVPRSAGKTTVEKGADFESRCLRLLAAMGCSVDHTGRTHDGGIDIRAEDRRAITGGRLIVQCKDWQNSVGEPTLRDLYGLVVSEGANKGIVITTSRFTEAARQFAIGKPLELVDGDALFRLETQYNDR